MWLGIAARRAKTVKWQAGDLDDALARVRLFEAACADIERDLPNYRTFSNNKDEVRDRFIFGALRIWIEAGGDLRTSDDEQGPKGKLVRYVTAAMRPVLADETPSAGTIRAVARKLAQKLGYVGFERIIDNRNADPILHRKARVEARAVVSIGLDVTVPDVDDLEPLPMALGFEGRQANQFAIFGEKASLEDVLLPIARQKEADLYLPSGEISDTLLYRMAKDADADGRPLVVFTLSDCDPAGHQMPVSIARKLQALRDLLFNDLTFEVVPVALTVEQVRELGLPSTPLKDTEKRADRWRTSFGIEQTEIDALATLRPNDLREIVERAFDPYFDRTLASRVSQAQWRWNERAQEAVDDQIDGERLAMLREQAAARLSELKDEIAHINRQLQLVASDHFDLPAIRIPEAEVKDDAGKQLLRTMGGSHFGPDRTQSIRHRGRAMNAPVREPHIAFGDPAAVLEEIGRLAWGLQIHAEIIERYAALGHVEGIALAAKDARSCLVRLLDLRKELGDDA